MKTKIRNKEDLIKNKVCPVIESEEESVDLFNNRANLSDEEYWKLFQTKFDNEEDFGQQNHDVTIDVSVKFIGLNGIVYESKQKNINCNIPDLETFFKTLKKTIRMVDENISDNEGYDENEL
jgi:hypothetical protein